MKYRPVIVVVAYNRPKSLARILESLKATEKLKDIKLIISIDNKEPDNLPVKDIADRFEWPFGEKEVIYQEKRLGLRQHILKCGDLSKEYGSVIILEDDLYVSPYFYEYAEQALNFYDNEDQIAGISLYGQPTVDMNEAPFKSIVDESDIFFLQFPSSWGQAWTNNQWIAFRNWLEKTPDISHIPISDVIIYDWPESSWKKLFCAYLSDQNKYFVFPRISLTTNFNDPGTNYLESVNFDGQTPLKIFDHPFRFKHVSDSLCKYDSYFELTPDSVKKITPSLKEYQFEMDLYGLKEPQKIKSEYIITSRPVRKFLSGFQRSLKPHEMNIILGLTGNDLFLCKTTDILEKKKSYVKKISDFKYYYSRYFPSKKLSFYLTFLKWMNKLMKP
jgi:hypothetical protein